MPKKRKINDFSGHETEKLLLKRNRLYLNSSDHFPRDDGFNSRKCVLWFQTYTKCDVMGPEGIEKFCQDVGIDPENIVLLVIAWKMNAKQMGYFTLQEWLNGFSELQCDCINTLQFKLSELYSIARDQAAFKCMFRYAYDFAKDMNQRSMDIETAKELLKVLLGEQWILFPQFSKFLEQSPYKIINKDQWCNILEFSKVVSNDLSNYDIDGAWPVMLDEFVEWMRNNSFLI